MKIKARRTSMEPGDWEASLQFVTPHARILRPPSCPSSRRIKPRDGLPSRVPSPILSSKGWRVSFPGQIFFTLPSCLLKQKHAVLIIIVTSRACFPFSFFLFAHRVSRDGPPLSPRALRRSPARTQHRRDCLRNCPNPSVKRKDENTPPRITHHGTEGLRRCLF